MNINVITNAITTTQVVTKSPTDDAFYDNLTLGLTKVLSKFVNSGNAILDLI